MRTGLSLCGCDRERTNKHEMLNHCWVDFAVADPGVGREGGLEPPISIIKLPKMALNLLFDSQIFLSGTSKLKDKL